MATHSKGDLNRVITALSSINGLIGLEDDKLNRELVGSMFPEKFIFEKLIDRTARINEIAEII